MNNKSTKPRGTRTTKPPKEQKVSRTHAPEEISPVEWQRILRRQFGREQAFALENMGTEPFFSEFRVGNPQSKRGYRVAIRGKLPGDNYCACPDYATNELGTCKHIEFVLARLEKKRGAKAAFARGYHPPFSELYLRNDGGRAIHFRAGTDCPPAVAKAAGRRDADRRAAALDRIFRQGVDDVSWKGLLKVPLYPYQAQGALFAVRAGRALVGDEMGLGKTIQAIAVAEILARHFGVSNTKSSSPTST